MAVQQQKPASLGCASWAAIIVGGVLCLPILLSMCSGDTGAPSSSQVVAPVTPNPEAKPLCDKVLAEARRAGLVVRAEYRPMDGNILSGAHHVVVNDRVWQQIDWDTKRQFASALVCARNAGGMPTDELVRIKSRMTGKTLALGTPGTGTFRPE